MIIIIIFLIKQTNCVYFTIQICMDLIHKQIILFASQIGRYRKRASKFTLPSKTLPHFPPPSSFPPLSKLQPPIWYLHARCPLSTNAS